METNTRRRLNPYAPPFYPSTFHFHHYFNHSRRPPQPTTRKSTNSVRYSLTPVPNGPRNWIPRRKAPDVSGHNSGSKVLHKSCFYKQIMPLNKNENSTSVMIRNIPNNYTKLLVEFLEDHCKNENAKKNTVRSAFDFVYLPVDFKHRLNAGYAFVNFTTAEAAWKFHICVKGKSWDLFRSKKIADVSRAKIQGKDALVRNFERMNLCSPSWDYLPVWFEPPRDGCMTSSSTMKMHMIGDVCINTA